MCARSLSDNSRPFFTTRRCVEQILLALFAILARSLPTSLNPLNIMCVCSHMQCGDSGCIEKSDLIERVLLCMSSQGVWSVSIRPIT